MSAATGSALSMKLPPVTDGRGTRPACPSAGDGRAACPHAAVKRVKLGEVCEEVRDRIPSAKVAVDDYVTTDNMVKDRGGVIAAEYVPEDVGLVNYKPGDVLIANIRPYLKKIWLANKEGGCSSDVVVLRSANNDLSPEYLHSVLCQDAFFDYVMLKPRGTKMPRGDRDWMKQFEFPLPPLSVQREIVARLEKELKAVEKAEAAFKSLAETAEAEFKAEQREVIDAGLFNSDNVDMDALKNHVDVLAGYAFKGDSFSETGVKICGGLIIDPDRIKWEECKYWESSVGFEDFLLQKDDVVVALDRPWISTGFKIGVIRENDLPALLIQRTARLRAKNIMPSYLFYVMNGEAFKEYCTFSGTTVPHISHKDIERFEIPICSIDMQREVVARLDAARSRCEKLKAAAGRGMALAADMRKAILKEAFE